MMNYLLNNAIRPPNPPEVGLKNRESTMRPVKEFKVPLRGVGGPFWMRGTIGLAAEIVRDSMDLALLSRMRGLAANL
jgi:hypothetical protein